MVWDWLSVSENESEDECGYDGDVRRDGGVAVTEADVGEVG